mgnify:FL=1
MNDIKPNSTEERIVWGTLVFSYLFYLTGTLYVVCALMGWALFFVMLLRWFIIGEQSKYASIPVTIWIWIIGMLSMLIALLIAHAEFNLSVAQTIKSSIGWAKGWALLALFPLLGAMVNIRPELITRGCCILASQSILFVGIGIVLAIIGFHGQLYISPLKVIGGPISTFEVNLFGLNPETGRPRWSFFAPWAPAAGLLSCLLFIICRHEKQRFWRRAGTLGALVMCIFCQSRTGWAILLLLIPSVFFINQLRKPVCIMMIGVCITSMFVFGEQVNERVNQAHQDVKDSRPGSTRVRSSLATIAVQRWESEAPIWGHGIVEKGPKMVEHMPIGSHHSWYGLLFVKGMVGALSLAIPMLLTVLVLLPETLKSSASQSGLLIMLVLLGYSFFENIEILAYLFWPALLWLGMVLNPLKSVLINHPLKGVTA